MRTGRTILLCAMVLVASVPGPSLWAANGPACINMVFNTNNSVVLNGSVTDLASLPGRLTALAQRKPMPVLCLIASPQSNYAEVQAALGVIQKSGFKVNMAGMQAQP
jgi:biopolymer transport protein ExbD